MLFVKAQLPGKFQLKYKPVLPLLLEVTNKFCVNLSWIATRSSDPSNGDHQRVEGHSHRLEVHRASQSRGQTSRGLLKHKQPRVRYTVSFNLL